MMPNRKTYGKSARNQQHIELYFSAIDETDKGLRVSDGVHRVWLPKSQITVNRFRGPQKSAVIVSMPLWLAKKTGCVE
jgi:hypothetical protein